MNPVLKKMLLAKLEQQNSDGFCFNYYNDAHNLFKDFGYHFKNANENTSIRFLKNFLRQGDAVEMVNCIIEAYFATLPTNADWIEYTEDNNEKVKEFIDKWIDNIDLNLEKDDYDESVDYYTKVRKLQRRENKIKHLLEYDNDYVSDDSNELEIIIHN